MKTFRLIARYRDDNRQLCEYFGEAQGRTVAEAKRTFGLAVASATGYPTLLVLEV